MTGAAPGAQHVGLVRRLEEHGRPSPALVEQVLAAPLSGRGRPALPWSGAAAGAPAAGQPPVEPDALGPEELLRVAVSALCDRLLAMPRTHPLPTPAERRGVVAALLARRRRGYRLAGDPWLVARVGECLRAQGRRPGGPDPRVLVLVDDPQQMLADVWTRRVLARGAVPWPAFCARHVTVDRLPPGADVPGLLEEWAGPGAVHLVLDPGAVPGLLGLDREVVLPARLSADALELTRRVGGVLGVLVAQPERRIRLREGLLPLLRGVDAPDAPLPGVPPRHRPWLADRTARAHRTVLAGDYPVHGDTDVLAAQRVRASPDRRPPHAEGTLAVALRALLATDPEEARG